MKILVDGVVQAYGTVHTESEKWKRKCSSYAIHRTDAELDALLRHTSSLFVEYVI
jgi:hypothetical protein